MRITNNLIINKFTRSLNTSALNLSNATDRVSTGRKFARASENTAEAMKAFKIRRGLARIETYQSNIHDVTGILDQAETTLLGIYDIITQAKESLVQGSTGTMSDSNRQTIANIFEKLQEQLLKLGNTNFAGKFIFGGPNTTEAPFTVDASSKLLYNGVDINSDDVSTEEVFADMGLGVSHDASGQLQTNTAFSISTPGSQVMGWGIDANGLPNNIYNLLGEIIKDLNNGDLSKTEAYTKKLSECADNVMVCIAGIGEKIKFVEFLNDRFEADKLNLQKKQSELEYEDYATALIEYSNTEFAYTAALQMGAKIIQKSLLDFLR